MSAVPQMKSVAPLKDLYDIGKIPPLGHVPEKMHAWVIRKERHGPPEKSMQQEVVATWPIADWCRPAANHRPTWSSGSSPR